MKKYLRAKQIAERLGVSQTTVWRWAAAGKISKPIKISPKVTVWDAEKLKKEIAEMVK